MSNSLDWNIQRQHSYEMPTLRIRVPAELLGTDVDPVPLQDLDTSTVDVVDGSIAIGKIGGSDDPRNSSAAGYVYATDRHATTLELDGTNTIIWRELSLNDKQVFRTIVRLATTGTADAMTVL